MRARIVFFMAITIISGAVGQNTINLNFTAVNDAAYIKLDSVKVMNRTQGVDTIIYWPDTTLSYQVTPGDSLLYIGYAMDFPVGSQSLGENEKKFQLFQSYPNPVRDQSSILLYVPLKGSVDMMVSDVKGKIVVNVERELAEGTHSFMFSPGDEHIYIITAWWNGIVQSIKILTNGQIEGKNCKLEYTGLDYENTSSEQSPYKALVVQESGFIDTTENDTTYTFQFATNIACPGTPTVEYQGQVYNTIQIFSQCWLKENLNVGTMIDGVQPQTNNNIIEKYCYNNEPDSCAKYGGLYLWNEMMQYTTQPGVQGICPPGWHLPTDEEWKVLEGAVDSWYGIGDSIWDGEGLRGFDGGINLKSINGWLYFYVNKNLYGFSGLPSGCRGYYGVFSLYGFFGYWLTSTETNNDYFRQRSMCHTDDEVFRTYAYKNGAGNSVRCIRNY